MLSYLCSQHLTGQSSAGFGKLSTIVLQLQRCCRKKENKRLHSLLPPDPGQAAPQQQPRVSVPAALFGMQRKSQHPLLCSGLRDAASPDSKCTQLLPGGQKGTEAQAGLGFPPPLSFLQLLCLCCLRMQSSAKGRELVLSFSWFLGVLAGKRAL